LAEPVTTDLYIYEYCNS